MKLYTKSMGKRERISGEWQLFVDVTCDECNKNQSLFSYKTNGDKCIQCGQEIKL